jgi:hypothetical protein
MEAKEIIELSGMKIGTGSGEYDISQSEIDDAVEEVYTWSNEVKQKIGPIGPGDYDEPIFIPITVDLLLAWASEHNCDAETVSVELVSGSHDYSQVITGVLMSIAR